MITCQQLSDHGIFGIAYCTINARRTPIATRSRRGWGAIRRLPSKRYQASYTGPDGCRHVAPHTFTEETDAEVWVGLERRMIEQDSWTPPAIRAAQVKAMGITVGEYAARWIAQRDLKDRTRLHYESLLARTIEPVLGRVALGSLTADTVRSWYAGLPSAHQRGKSHSYGLLHAVLNTAVIDDRLLESNPSRIKGAMVVERRRQPMLLSAEEVWQLAEKIDPRYKALILIAAWCGLRWTARALNAAIQHSEHQKR